VDADVAGTCERRLIEVAAGLFDFAEKHQSLIRLVFTTVFAAPEEIPSECLDKKRRRRNLEVIRQIADDGIASGELDSSCDSMELAYGVFGAISYHMRMHLLNPEGALDRRRAERVVQLFLNGAKRRTRR
jgi:hypothetical protein